MAIRYLVVALIASAITVFALQNTETVSVRFLFWALDLPLAGVILGSVAAGVVLVGLPLWIDRWRLTSRARVLERRLAAVDAERAEAERVAVTRAEAARVEAQRPRPPSSEGPDRLTG